MAAGRLAGTLGTVGKKVLPRFRDMFVQAILKH